MATFSETGLPPTVRLGDTSDVVQVQRRDTSFVGLPMVLPPLLVVRMAFSVNPVVQYRGRTIHKRPTKRRIRTR